MLLLHNLVKRRDGGENQRSRLSSIVKALASILRTVLFFRILSVKVCTRVLFIEMVLVCACSLRREAHIFLHFRSSLSRSTLLIYNLVKRRQCRRGDKAERSRLPSVVKALASILRRVAKKTRYQSISFEYYCSRSKVLLSTVLYIHYFFSKSLKIQAIDP